MKKLLLTMGTIGVAAAPLAAVVSCGKKSEDTNKNGTYEVPQLTLTQNTTGSNTFSGMMSSTAPAKVSASKLSFITSSKGKTITDKGFNQGMYESVKAASDGTPAHFAPGGSEASAFSTVYDQALQGADLFVTGGNEHTPRLNEYSFPTGKGAILWGQQSSNKNVVSVATKREEYTFLAGVLTAMYMNNHYSGETGANAMNFGSDGHLKTGGYVGLPIDALFIFITGYQQGIKWFNDYVVGNPMYKDLSADGKPFQHKVEWIDMGGKNDYATGGFDPSEVSMAKANKLVNANADFIFVAAGGQNLDVINSIKNHNKTGKSFLVGMDSSMETKAEFAQFVKFSAVDYGQALTNLVTRVANTNAADHIDLGTQVSGGLRDTTGTVIGLKTTAVTYLSTLKTGTDTNLFTMVDNLNNSSHNLSDAEKFIYFAAQSNKARQLDF